MPCFAQPSSIATLTSPVAPCMRPGIGLRAANGTSAGAAWPGVLLWVIGRHASLARSARQQCSSSAGAHTHLHVVMPCRRLLEAGCRWDSRASQHQVGRIAHGTCRQLRDGPCPKALPTSSPVACLPVPCRCRGVGAQHRQASVEPRHSPAAPMTCARSAISQPVQHPAMGSGMHRC